jgi:hypothetical protein
VSIVKEEWLDERASHIRKSGSLHGKGAWRGCPPDLEVREKHTREGYKGVARRRVAFGLRGVLRTRGEPWR